MIWPALDHLLCAYTGFGIFIVMIQRRKHLQTQFVNCQPELHLCDLAKVTVQVKLGSLYLLLVLPGSEPFVYCIALSAR